MDQYIIFEVLIKKEKITIIKIMATLLIGEKFITNYVYGQCIILSAASRYRKSWFVMLRVFLKLESFKKDMTRTFGFSKIIGL